MSRLSDHLFLDANLLVLLIVGGLGRDRIAHHRRTRRFTVGDYDLLLQLLSGARALVTPHTLTEASNLLAQHGEPERTHLLESLRSLVEGSDEEFVPGRTAVRDPDFPRLGLTDAVLLEAISSDRPLLTTDFHLYRTAATRQAGSAYNFGILRDLENAQ